MLVGILREILRALRTAFLLNSTLSYSGRFFAYNKSRIFLHVERGLVKGRESFRRLSKPAPKWTTTKIKKLREEVFQMSQPVFASLLNVKTATVRAWEQGQRSPDGAASRLLEILSKDVDIAEKLAS